MSENKENKVPVNVRVSPDVELELRRRSLEAKKHDRKATKDAEVEAALRTHLKMEQKIPCPLCQSTTYAGTIHTDRFGISESVLKTEQMVTLPAPRDTVTLSPDEGKLIRAWRRARHPKFRQTALDLLEAARYVEGQQE